MYDITVTRFAKPWIHLDFFYHFTNFYKEEQEHWVIMRELSNCVSFELNATQINECFFLILKK